METLAYIYLSDSYEAAETTELVATPQTINVVWELNGLKPFSRAWIYVLSFLVASSILGFSMQAQAQLSQGRRGSDVTELQKQLRELGYFNRSATGTFGSLTKQAVMRFQQDEGLKADGVVEEQTKTALLRRLGRSENANESSASEPKPNESSASEPKANESSASEPKPNESSASEPKPNESSASEPVRRITLRRGASGAEVEALQKLLTAAGVYEGSTSKRFDAKTVASVRQFQRNNRLFVDGVVGPRTWSALLDSSNSNTTVAGPFNRQPFTDSDAESALTQNNNIAIASSALQQGSKGTQVRQIQQRLRELGYFKGRTTGNFGPLTKAAVTKFQQDSGLTANGTVDEATKSALLQRKSDVSDSPNKLSIRELQGRLKDKGFYSGPVDGDFNDLTKAAIKAAQQAYGVSEDDILQARF